MSTNDDTSQGESDSDPIVQVVEEVASVDVESAEAEENETSIVDTQGRRIILDDEPNSVDLDQDF